MKYAKYKFGNEIQDQTVYTKTDIDAMLTVYYKYNYYSDKIIEALLKENYDLPEAIDMANKIKNELIEQLPEREYLHIEFLNIWRALPNIKKALQTEKEYNKLWNNVLSVHEVDENN